MPADERILCSCNLYRYNTTNYLGVFKVVFLQLIRMLMSGLEPEFLSFPSFFTIRRHLEKVSYTFSYEVLPQTFYFWGYAFYTSTPPPPLLRVFKCLTRYLHGSFTGFYKFVFRQL